MLRKIISHISSKKTAKETGFLELSSREQKKIIKEAARRANQDQLKLVKEYEHRFGHLETNSCE